MSEPRPSDRHDASDPDDTFAEIVDEETQRDPDLAVIEAGSRTLRTQSGPPQGEAVPDRPADPETDRALREVEQELAGRWGETKLEPSVTRIAALMDVLGEPQRAYPSIHITGTNGKTSTARMIEALLNALDLRTGRYTSPHVQSITERISLDGAPIDAERFIETYNDVKPYVEMVDAQQPYRLSFFEVLTGMAYAAFADAPVDVAVVEVGMGGTWDATNVIDASVAVVTPISMDHTDRLGSTPAEIAGEKSGIVKQDATVILAQQPVDAAQVMLKKAVEVDATVAREGMEFGIVSREIAVGGQLLTLRGLGGEYDNIFLPLYGAHQAHNAVVALAAVEAFFGIGAEQARSLDVEAVRKAFLSVLSPGRLEVVRSSPTVVLDAAHNPAGCTRRLRGDLRGVQLLPADRGRRHERRQGRPGAPRSLRADLRRDRRHPELQPARHGRGRARRRRRRGLRQRARPGRATPGRRPGGGDHPRRGRGRVRGRRGPGDRIRDHGRRGPAASGKALTLCVRSVLRR